MLATWWIHLLTRRLKVAVLLGKERFICKCAISVNLDSCTAKRLVGETKWLSSYYLFNLMRAILLKANATTASDASTGKVDDSMDHASALVINGSNLLLSSCIFSYMYDKLDFVSNALF